MVSNRLFVGVAWEKEAEVPANVGYTIVSYTGGLSHLRLRPFLGRSAPRKFSGVYVRYVLISTVCRATI